MKKFLLPALLIAVLLAAACGSPAVKLGPEPEYVEEVEASEILDHRDKEEGREIPEWTNRYLSGGLRLVEELPQYRDKFIFISKASGSNLKALLQWSSGFTVEQDLARMVSARIEARFTGAAATNPDEEYGRYFEALVINSTNAAYSSAKTEESYWIKKRYLDAEGDPEREGYDYYILVTTDREVLERQIRSILNRTTGDPAPTRDQNYAIERLKSYFFCGIYCNLKLWKKLSAIARRRPCRFYSTYTAGESSSLKRFRLFSPLPLRR
jgi:hypothetical protein